MLNGSWESQAILNLGRHGHHDAGRETWLRGEKRLFPRYLVLVTAGDAGYASRSPQPSLPEALPSPLQHH